MEKFTKNSLCFTREISQVHKFTSSQVTHLKNYLGWQNNRRATEEENGWNPPFIKFLPPHLRTPSPKRMPRAHAQHQWTLGAHQTPLPPNRPVRATPSPKRMLRAHAQLEWTLGAHQPPPPRDRYEHPLPQQTGTSNPIPQKDAGGATSVDAGGASDPFPQQTGTSNPFPLTPTSLYKGITDRAHS